MNQREWLDHLFEKDMGVFRAKHGLTNTVSTGPATAEEMEAARVAMGNPQTHEAWAAEIQRDAFNREAHEGCDE